MKQKTQAILKLFGKYGDSEYGGEAVTQMQHACQAAALAESEDTPGTLIVAALLHDVGHLLHDLPHDAPDDRHEFSGANFLKGNFVEAVVEPIRLHVISKRYLCAVDAHYFDQLSEPSRISLRLQGGPMTPEEIQEFEANRYFRDAIAVRRWDDLAKVPGLTVPPVDHYADLIDACVCRE